MMVARSTVVVAPEKAEEHVATPELTQHIVAFAVLLIGVALGPFVIYPIFVMKIMCYALFACGFNLLFGYVGLLPFGQAAFFGISAYVTAWSATTLGINTTGAILLGTASAAVLGTAFGFIAIRGKGLVFSMITLALAQMTYFVCLQAPFTNGEDGIQKIPRGSLLGISLESDMSMYWYAAAVFIVVFLLYWRIIHSPFGQVLKGIREHEDRTISLGFPTAKYKYLAFVLAALISGVAGATKAFVFGVVTLADVQMDMSTLALLIALAGGTGTIFGPVIGAIVIVMLEVAFSGYPAWITVINGLVFIACVLMFRRGIVGEINRLFKTSL